MQLYSPSSSTSSSSASSSSSSASNPSFFFSSSKSTKLFRSSRIIPTDTKYLRIQSPPSQLTLPPYSPVDHYFPALLHDPPSSQAPNNSLIEPSEQTLPRRDNLEQFLVVRRPLKDQEDDEEVKDGDDSENEVGTVNESDDDTDERNSVDDVSPIDSSLKKFAKKLPMFEPSDDEMSSSSAAKEKPLLVNLDLALYKAKIMTRNYQFEEVEKLLEQCINIWPEDGRAYVALGKALRKQSKMGEARALYEKGCQATQGENAYIWQCWADLENKMGNVRKARQLFDAATVADKRHIAAWHAWAVLELKQGNIQKARNLLAKGLNYCGGNEYVYQTLALLELKAGRYEQARYLFKQATKCNPKSCASWLAWAQLEMQQENNPSARALFERAVQASPKNRFAWHVWGLFEANINNIDKARKLFKIGHLVNPYDPVLLQSLSLLEYRHSTANLARVLFRRASELDPSHQPVWIAWGWMEWKEGNIATARELYQKALSISATTESAARCLHAWGVLEQRVGNLSAARRLLRSSLNINSQSYVTWMTWATLEEDQGNSIRAEEIRNLYFQQRTEVVDDASWVMGFMDIIDPALDSLKKFLNMDQTSSPENAMEPLKLARSGNEEIIRQKTAALMTDIRRTSFDLDGFIKEKLSLDASKLDVQMEASLTSIANTKGTKGPSKLWRLNKRGR